MDASAPLRQVAAARGLHVGAAVAPKPLAADPAYAAILARELDLVTTENALKFGSLRPRPDAFAFDDADAIVAFAEAHEMAVRGHTLVWHQQVPDGVADVADAELATVLDAHIDTVVGRYSGRVAYWDVVNEAVADDGSLRDTRWLRALGPGYLARAFTRAHAADPAARLFHNDYGAEGLGPKADGVHDLSRAAAKPCSSTTATDPSPPITPWPAACSRRPADPRQSRQ